MFKKHLLFNCIFFLSSILSAQSPFALPNTLYSSMQKHFNEQATYHSVAYIEKRWRLAGNPDFDSCIYKVESILKKAGFKNETEANPTDRLTYRIERRKLKRPAWMPHQASLRLSNTSVDLLNLTTNKNMLAINSASTSGLGVTGEIIDIGSGQETEIERLSLKDKILYGTGSLRSLHALAIKHQALGVLTYSMPSYNQPSKITDHISFSSIPYLDSIENKWAILLSYDANEKIKKALALSKTIGTVHIQSSFHTDDELTLVAEIKGRVKPEERFVFSAHVQEPGANDNASGVATLAEMATVTSRMFQSQEINPERTITFIWGDEIISTRRFIQEDSLRRKGILWGLSLDMVGEDILKTGGSFLIEKMPDPSAIWTRGEDKHTEWGGHPLKESDLFPHYFNDLLYVRCLQQSKFTNWKVATNPFEGGSDHTPFLDAHIPGLLMWHFTDVYYHTDGDRLDKVSAREMENVGVSALATALALTQGTEKQTLAIINEIKNLAITRINKEKKLSQLTILAGGNSNEEQHIVDVWKQYYLKVLDSCKDIYFKGSTPKIAGSINRVKSLIEKK